MNKCSKTLLNGLEKHNKEAVTNWQIGQRKNQRVRQKLGEREREWFEIIEDDRREEWKEIINIEDWLKNRLKQRQVIFEIT